MVSGSGICSKRVFVDAMHHRLGRLASILAKELLNSRRLWSSDVINSLVVLFSEDEVLEVPSQAKEYQAFSWPHSLPMIPHKTKRGEAALARLKVLRIQVGHKYCLLGKLLSEVGLNNYEIIRVISSFHLLLLHM
ncbi:60S ribosomal protein L13A [Striga asiatica]|uniref:60S ribosomal protein L13A n=1 Tax=Striga asiatica TaxID=4170 RepID=A0A5A7PII0_STRAF|nr:60S ribosomal protein L13A [Striga asiatica]